MSTLQMPWEIRESNVKCQGCNEYMFLVVKNNFHYQYYCLTTICEFGDIPEEGEKIIKEKKTLSVGIYISIVKKTQKKSRCNFCFKSISKGTTCINGFGYNYDGGKAYERIHIEPKCYEEWVRQRGILEIQKIKEMIDNVMKK